VKKISSVETAAFVDLPKTIPAAIRIKEEIAELNIVERSR